MNAGMRTICQEGTGLPLVQMWLPDDWKETVTVNPKVQTGYGEPEFITVSVVSPDRHSNVYYQSAFHYRDDLLSETASGYDSYGNLRRKFMTPEAFVDYLASIDFKENSTEVSVFSEKEWDTNPAQYDRYLKNVTGNADNDPYSAIGEVYCKGYQRIYSYKHKGYARKRLYSLIIRSTEYAYWAPVPELITRSLNDPFMASIAQRTIKNFPNARYEKTLNEWVYTISWFKDWRIDQRIILDSPESQFEELRNTVLRPLVSHGVYYTNELRARTDSRQKTANEINRKKREEESRQRAAQKQENDRRRAEEEERRARHRQAQESLRKTQREISDIRRSMYENTQKSQAKTREIWGDAIRGDTRFTDKYGDEHVIHTYNNYAYKNGDTYVTSDSPLDHDWDWEELEKKKY